MFKKLVIVSRILLGLMFIMAGSDGLLRSITGNGFFPVPELSAELTVVMTGLMGMKYLFPLVKLLEIVAGLFLVSGFYLNLAIVLITPIMVNILGINLFVDRSGAPMVIALSVFLIIIVKDRWSYFKPLVCTKK